MNHQLQGYLIEKNLFNSDRRIFFMNKSERKQYQKPEITDHANLGSLTKGDSGSDVGRIANIET